MSEEKSVKKEAESSKMDFRESVLWR
ncbi:MAG: hypothetical protein US06_C0023G0001, partial [Parcubacteria group bacterium GW2011_GWC2_36_17]